MKKTILTSGLFLLFTTSAIAGPIYFQDNFDGENGGVGVLNYNGFINWTASDGTVDLIGNGYFDFHPGNGLYLDLDGSTQDAGKITTSIYLDSGSYLLDFAFAGNSRDSLGDSMIVNVGLGSLLNFTLTTGANLPFTTFSSIFPGFSSFNVATAGTYALSFEGVGGDNIGLLLDNVLLERTDPIPEPATMLLFGAGLAGLIGSKTRRKK